MKFMFNNTNKTTKLEDDQIFKLMLHVLENFECIDDCKCKEILGFDCFDNDNHCPIKQILLQLSM